MNETSEVASLKRRLNAEAIAEGGREAQARASNGRLVVDPEELIVLERRARGGSGGEGARAAIRVLLADGERVVRAGLRALLEGETDITVSAEAASGGEAVALATRTQPDVALIDVGLPGLDWVEVTRRILASSRVKVLILSADWRDEDLFAALRAGASGALSTDVEAVELSRAVRTLASGGALLSPDAARRVIDHLASLPDPQPPNPEQFQELTAREREIVTLVATGLSNDEIAKRLVISPATAKTHLRRSMKKLHAHDRAKLVALAYQTGFAEPPFHRRQASAAGRQRARAIAAARGGSPSGPRPDPRLEISPVAGWRARKLINCAEGSAHSRDDRRRRNAPGVRRRSRRRQDAGAVSEQRASGPDDLRQVIGTPEGEAGEVILLEDDAGRSRTVDAASPGAIRVLIADGQALARASYRVLLETHDSITVVGEATGAKQAVALAGEARPDVALIDLELPDLEGVETVAQIVSQPALARVAVLVLTASDSDERVFGALRAGAMGVVLKDAEPSELVRAVQVLAAGEALLSGGVMRCLLDAFASQPQRRQPSPEQLRELTGREREVVALVAKGLSNEEIGQHLVITKATVKAHVSHAMVKLHARHRAQLVVLAYETGLVSPRPKQPTLYQTPGVYRDRPVGRPWSMRES
jgi:DNA-binding NarL/FixJ family response regulator